MDLTKLPECSELEIKNAAIIAEFLSEIEDISYKKLREDIFEVTSAGLTCIVDVEDTLVCVAMDVCDLPDQGTAELLLQLMELNAQAIHGKFCLSGSKILMKDNLEIENIDKNEFEASLSWLFAMVRANIKNISEAVEDRDEDDDDDDDGIDIDDVLYVDYQAEDRAATLAAAKEEMGEPVAVEEPAVVEDAGYESSSDLES